jgi:hypothetical protein
MRIRKCIPPLLLGGVATAIAVAPLAAAAPSGPTCTSTGAVSICQRNGHVGVTATHPPVNYQSQYPFFGPYPYGLLFHHGGHR